MKGILTTIGFILSLATTFAQIPVARSSNAVTAVDQHVQFAQSMAIPAPYDTTSVNGLDSVGSIIYARRYAGIYIRDTFPGGKKWTRVLKSGDAGTGVTTFNTRSGTVTLLTVDITAALGYTPTNPNGTNLQYTGGDGSKITFPIIPAQFNPIQGYGIHITGSYPNNTFIADTGTLFPAVRATISGGGGGGITSLNGLTGATQTFAVGTSGTNFNIQSAGTTHTFNIPITSGSNTGLVTPTLFNLWNAKWGLSGNSGTISGTNFIGTTDGVPLSFRIGNSIAGKLQFSGGTSFGYLAGQTDPYSTAIGYSALAAGASNSDFNTAVGYMALTANTTGQLNTALGHESLLRNTTGFNNIGIGPFTISNNTTGTFNTAVGYDALQANVIGNYNTTLGFQSGFNISGSGNIVIGSDSSGLMPLTTGSYNTIIGGNISGISATLWKNIILADGQGNQRITVDSFGTAVVHSKTALGLPSGTTAQRPTSAVAGYTRWNTDSTAKETFNGSIWVKDGSGGGGGGSGTVTQVNSGLGLLGGPITTTGTLVLDTTYSGTLGGIHTRNYNDVRYAPISVIGGTNSNVGAGNRWAIPGTNNIKTAFPGFAINIDSTSNSQGLTFKFDSTAAGGFHTQPYNDLRYAAIGTIDTNVIVNTAQPSGTVFSDNFARSSLGANYTATGGTFTFPSSAYLQMSAGDGTFNNYVVKNQSISTHQHTDSLKFVPQIVNNTSFGVSIGVQSWQPGTKRDLLAQFSVANLTLVGNITIYGQPDYPTAILVQSGSLSFSVGDTLLAVLVRNDNTVTATYTDLTTPASVTCTYTYPTTNVSGYLLHNTGLPILYNNGGTNNVVFWKVTNNQSRTNDVLVGNSLISYDASGFATSWPNLLYNARTDYSVVCGPGDRTAQALTDLPELLSYAPKKVFVDLGINDFLGSVPAATFSTQYDSLCHSIKNLNVPGYLLSISPTSTSVVAFNDTIKLKAIKYGFTYIDIYSWLKSPTGTTLNPIYDGGDGLHWNDAAHSLVASLLQPYRNRYSNNIPSGGAFALTTIGTTGPATYIGNILNIPAYAGLGGLTTGRIPVASSSSSLTDFAELTWNNSTKLANINGTLQVGDQTLTHAGYNTFGVGGSAKSAAIDFWDNGNFMGEAYTTASTLNIFSNTGLPYNIFTNGATTTPNIYAFSQKVGINTASPDSSLTIAGGLDIKSGLIMPALASGNASPSQTGARVALNIDANGRVGTYTPSLETTLANGANLSNSYTTTLGANSWTMSENSTGRFKINGMQTASGTYTVLTKNSDSSFTQISLAALAAAIGGGGTPDTLHVVKVGAGQQIGYTNGADSLRLKSVTNALTNTDSSLTITPSGSNGQVQYDSLGLFAASVNLQWKNSTATLILGGSAISGTFTQNLFIAGNSQTGLLSSQVGTRTTITGGTYTDNTTSASGTAALWAPDYINGPTLAATNSSVTYTKASTLYINSPSAGTNITITKPYSLIAHSGNVGIDAGFLETNSIRSNGSAPGIAAGVGAGTSPTVSITGSDMAGTIAVTPGLSPGASGTVATITYNVPYASQPRVVLTPANSATALLTGITMVFVNDASSSNSSFIITSGTTALTPATTYLFYYHVIQ